MATFKCKMCGGSLEVSAGVTVIECEYCGTQQTLPRLDNDKRANMYDRANHFRRNNEFDKAMAVYENILNEDNTDAEAYWSLVLCRYGIEYVEDPMSHKRIPTVNRAQFTSIFDDDNYKSALQYADMYQRTIYEEEARAINEIQKGILAISQKEEPFDVFICYKESDENGRRTPDSVLAQDLYYQLKQEGFKVFFSRITLEDKLGSAYEPYIFAALNSAKIMVVLGTKAEYFNAVWVKNEWSRYLALIKQGQKKMLIPAYRDMDPYNLPEEFSHLQAQDMSKLGFMQDLIRGIKKIVKKDAPAESAPVTERAASVASAPTGNVTALLKRATLFIEEGDFESANAYCERVLDVDPENSKAYIIKLMSQLKFKKENDLELSSYPLDQYPAFRNAVRFADEQTKRKLDGYCRTVADRIEQDRRREADRLAEQQRINEERRIRAERENRARRTRDGMYQEKGRLENQIASRQKERDAYSVRIENARKELKNVANPFAVRFMAMLCILAWICGCAVAIFSEIAFFSAIMKNSWGIWFAVTGVYFLLFIILMKTAKRSAAWTWLNIPTLGIFGFFFAISHIKRAGRVKGEKQAELDKLMNTAAQLSLEIDKLQDEHRIMERKIEEFERSGSHNLY